MERAQEQLRTAERNLRIVQDKKRNAEVEAGTLSSDVQHKAELALEAENKAIEARNAEVIARAKLREAEMKANVSKEQAARKNDDATDANRLATEARKDLEKAEYELREAERNVDIAKEACTREEQAKRIKVERNDNESNRQRGMGGGI